MYFLMEKEPIFLSLIVIFLAGLKIIKILLINFCFFKKFLHYEGMNHLNRIHLSFSSDSFSFHFIFRNINNKFHKDLIMPFFYLHIFYKFVIILTILKHQNYSSKMHHIIYINQFFDLFNAISSIVDSHDISLISMINAQSHFYLGIFSYLLTQLVMRFIQLQQNR